MDKRQQRTLGAIIRISLGNGDFAFGQILDKANFAFFALKTKSEDPDINIIVSRPILFIVAVYDRAVTSGRWKKIGKLAIDESLLKLPNKFIQDSHTGKFEIYDANTGETRSSTRDEVQDLECAAVWEPEHVESRLRDHYDGKENVWVNQLKLQ
jgi:hypothetical protein